MFIGNDKQNILIISVCELLYSIWYGTAVRWTWIHRCGPFTFVRKHTAQRIFFQFTIIVLHRSPNHTKGYCRRRWSTLHKRIAICQVLLVTCSLRFNWSRVGDCNFVRDSDMKYAACSLIYNSNVDPQPPIWCTYTRTDHTIEVQTLHVRPFSLPYT